MFTFVSNNSVKLLNDQNLPNLYYFIILEKRAKKKNKQTKQKKKKEKTF